MLHLRRTGRRCRVHGGGESLQAAWRAKRERKAVWGMWRPVWHMFPICFRLYIWGGILSVPSLQQVVNCTSSTRLVSSKGKRKKACRRILVFMICGVWVFEECLEPFDFWVVFLKFQRGWRNSLGQNFQIACGKLCRRVWTLITVLSLHIFVKAWETWPSSTGRMRGPLLLHAQVYNHHLLWDKMSPPHFESLARKFEWAPGQNAPPPSLFCPYIYASFQKPVP